VRIGLLHSRIRTDEKMLLEAAQRRGVEVVLLDDRELVLDVHDKPEVAVDAVLERSISFYHGLYATRFLEAHGIPVVNRAEVIRVCGDKAETSLRLARAGVPTPRTLVAFDEASALRALDQLGYPAVLKPVVGSWGRLLAKVDNPEQAQAFLEHKSVLGGPLHSVFYLQEYVAKPQRDIRAFWVGDEVIAAIWRTNTQHWITNTAQGGTASNCEITKDLAEICARSAEAVGGGVLALDIMEGPHGLVCHEVNHAMEFKNSVKPTGVDIPAHILDYTIREARR